MKTIGLLGGMSWESTVSYYRLINEAVRERLGGLHSARCVLYSVDFAEVEALQSAGRWAEATGLLLTAARGLEAAGADFVLICTNTMHKVADAIEAEAGLSLLHIADATGAALQAAGVSCVGLLGTRFTMDDESIVSARLRRQGGIEVLAPDPADRDEVHRVIFDELCRGVIDDRSRATYVAVIERLRERGAQGVILGCTEIALLIDAAISPLPVFDSTALHAAAAAEWMLQDPSTGDGP